MLVNLTVLLSSQKAGAGHGDVGILILESLAQGQKERNIRSPGIPSERFRTTESRSPSGIESGHRPGQKT